jgi:hypothetical protein
VINTWTMEIYVATKLWIGKPIKENSQKVLMDQIGTKYELRGHL